MIEDIQKYRAMITEGYEERVQQIVDRVFDRLQPDIKYSKEQLLTQITNAAYDVPEMTAVTVDGKPSKAGNDFIRDVARALAVKVKQNHIRLPRNNLAKRIGAKQKLQHLGQIMQSALGDAFPDGDPIDLVLSRGRKAGFDREFILDNLDKAAKLEGSKSWNDMVADFWEQIKADNPEMQNIGDRNPWR